MFVERFILFYFGISLWHVNDLFCFGAAVTYEASVVPGGLLDAVGFEMQQ